MGKKAKEIVKIDVKKLIDLLNKALADEWLAYYQYWIGAKVVEGPMRSDAIAEMVQHATDELRHAGMIADRIIQLGGVPILEPKKWYEATNCGYAVPKDFYIKIVVKQNIEGEQCAIETYNKLLEITREKDSVTHFMIHSILADEVVHEEDLQNLFEDLEYLERNVKCKK
ncbi:TPA: ferritin [Candidatus Dependentiae bacterium]|nr:MAG: Ferritin and Dps [candidate division TM6 bacterium GW2011_GWE2_31_21]KKP54078.1 MAG: Ferritin and Dps [candidate division TM6 bacterium GW2011_GWF2_33_332]HBS48340.1 ferritin [Candidatus Dependentiae bacterium]HBZ72986.1 ferritin [Candidatus Dependentiae bacterium]